MLINLLTGDLRTASFVVVNPDVLWRLYPFLLFVKFLSYDQKQMLFTKMTRRKAKSTYWNRFSHYWNCFSLYWNCFPLYWNRFSHYWNCFSTLGNCFSLYWNRFSLYWNCFPTGRIKLLNNCFELKKELL